MHTRKRLGLKIFNPAFSVTEVGLVIILSVTMLSMLWAVANLAHRHAPSHEKEQKPTGAIFSFLIFFFCAIVPSPGIHSF